MPVALHPVEGTVESSLSSPHFSSRSFKTEYAPNAGVGLHWICNARPQKPGSRMGETPAVSPISSEYFTSREGIRRMLGWVYIPLVRRRPKGQDSPLSSPFSSFDLQLCGECDWDYIPMIEQALSADADLPSPLGSRGTSSAGQTEPPFSVRLTVDQRGGSDRAGYR